MPVILVVLVVTTVYNMLPGLFMSAGVVIWDRMGKIFFVFFIIQIMFKKKSNKIKKWGIIKKSEGSAPMRNFRIFFNEPFPNSEHSFYTFTSGGCAIETLTAAIGPGPEVRKRSAG